VLLLGIAYKRDLCQLQANVTPLRMDARASRYDGNIYRRHASACRCNDRASRRHVRQ
jgi:hypothetical protein